MASGLDPVYLDRIKASEGFVPRASWDYKQHTNGYGTRAAYPGEVIDRDEADRRFQTEIGRAQGIVDRFAPNLDPGTRAALTSLTFNAGADWTSGGLGRAIQSGNMDAARSLFQQYTKAGGETLPGLVTRRASEAQWFGAPSGEGAPQVATAAVGAPSMPVANVDSPTLPHDVPTASGAGIGASGPGRSDPVSRALSLAQASEPSAPQFMPLPVAPVGANPAALRLASAVTPYAGNSQPLALASGGAAREALRLARADGGAVAPTGLGTALSWASDPPMVEEQRGTLVPGMTPRHVAGEQPRTQLAVPGILHDPYMAMARLFDAAGAERGGMPTDDRQNARDAFDVAGLAAMGGFGMPKPANSLGSAGGKLAQEVAPIRAYRGVGVGDEFGAHPEIGNGAIFATDNPGVASEFAFSGLSNPSPAVYPVDMRFSNPKVVDARRQIMELDGLAEDAMRGGHDGLIVNNVRDTPDMRDRGPIANVYAALQPGTVRSATTGELLFSNPDTAAAVPLATQAAKELPMDQASRLARAMEMGFDTPAFHVTGADFDEFKPHPYRGASFFARTEGDAYNGARAGANDFTGTGTTHTMHVVLPSEEIMGLALTPAEKRWWSSLPDHAGENEVAGILDSRPDYLSYGAAGMPWYYIYDEIRKPDGSFSYNKKPQPKLDWDTAARTNRNVYGSSFPHYNAGSERFSSDYAKRNGMAGFTQMDEGGLSIGIADPTRIRSVNAAFDPAKSSSADLLAVNPSTAAILSLLAGQQAQTGTADPGDNMRNSASSRALRLARADGGGIPSEVSTDWLLNRLEDNPHGVGGIAPSVALPMEPTGEARGQGRGESRDPMPSDPVERAGMTPEAQAKAFLRSELPSALLGAAPGPARAVVPVGEALWNTANIVAPAALATMNSGAAAKDEKAASSVEPEMGREEFLTAWRKNNPRHAVDPGEITARALDAFRASDAYKSLPDASGPKTRGVRERAEKEFVADYMDRFGAGEPQVDYDARADKAWTAYQQHMTDTAAERKADAAYARVMGDRGLAETPFAETWWGRNVNPNITPLIVGGLSGLALGAKGALAERNAAGAWEKALHIARTSEIPSERVAAASTAKSMQKAFPESAGLSGYGVPMALGAIEGVGSTAAPVLWDRALPAESAKHRAAAAALAELPNDHPARKKYQAILDESAVNRPRDEALSVNLGDLGIDAAMRAGMGASAAAAGKTIGGMPSPSGARVSTLREMTTAKPISPDAVEREAERLYAVRNADSDFRFSDRQMRASQQIDDATRQLEQEALRGIVDKGPSPALKRQVQEALETRALPPPKAPEPQGSLPTPESSASPALPPPVKSPAAAKSAPEPLPQDKPAATRGQGAAEKALRLASPDKVKERSPLTSPTPAEGTLPNPMRVVGALDYHYGLLNRQPRFEKNAASIVNGSDDGLREGVRVALKGLLGRSPKPDEIERFMPEAKVWASRMRNGGGGESSALPSMTAKDMIPKRASGGSVVDRALSLATGGAAKRMAVGPLMGPTGGRADHLPVSVPAGSHVVPADVVSGLGEGNTHAGMLVLDKMFNQGPYGSRVGKRHRAAGGEVPIMASDGEYVVAPEIVEAWGNGNPQAGHDAIDKWIVSKRGDIIDTMQRLPGPAKD